MIPELISSSLAHHSLAIIGKDNLAKAYFRQKKPGKGITG